MRHEAHLTVIAVDMKVFVHRHNTNCFIAVLHINISQTHQQ